MVDKQNVKIILFIGLPGSGKSVATEYVADQGIPQVSFGEAAETLSQLQHLIYAGQRKIVVDGIDSWDSYKILKRQFPGSVLSIALLTEKPIRVRRLAARVLNPETEKTIYELDQAAIEKNNIGGVIAVADYFLSGTKNLEELYINIDRLLTEIDFFKD